MNRIRFSDLDCLVAEMVPPPLHTDIPDDDELDALCDLSMRLADQEADPSLSG